MKTEPWCGRDDNAAHCFIIYTREYLCFPGTRGSDRQHVNPEGLVLALTRLSDSLVERGVNSLVTSL